MSTITTPKRTRAATAVAKKTVLQAPIAEVPQELSDIRADELLKLGLSPAAALELLGHLIVATVSASKETMERIKTMDKLINTARAVLDTKLKTEEAAAITARLDELEARLDALSRDQGREEAQEEVWRDP